MSTTAVPKYSSPNRKDPISTLLESRSFSNHLNDNINSATNAVVAEIWKKTQKRISNACDKYLKANDEYLENLAGNVWDDFSFWTGNTRGALKYSGKYPRTDLKFDKEEWFRPKTLTNLKPRSVTVSWEVHGTKHHPKNETHTKTYSYAPGALKVKITGEDYAPRIPLPPHGGGNIDMLIEVFEEMKDTEWKKVAKRRGL